jgi:hypothetical protein
LRFPFFFWHTKKNPVGNTRDQLLYLFVQLKRRPYAPDEQNSSFYLMQHADSHGSKNARLSKK